jgi:hypothetical protein
MQQNTDKQADLSVLVDAGARCGRSRRIGTPTPAAPTSCNAAGLALVRVRTTTDVRSAMAVPSVKPDAAIAVAPVDEFLAACR